MFEDYLERRLTRDGRRADECGEGAGPPWEDTDWHEIRSGVDQGGEVYFVGPW